MAEAKNQEESTLHEKRKHDLLREDDEINANKIQKLQTLNNNTSPVAEENGKNGDECEEEDQTPINSAVPQAKIDTESAAEPENDDEEDEEDYDEDDEDGENSNAVDRKGKGILRDDKGKGKLIEEEDDDDDDDSDSDFSQSEAESDLSDDPLAEVDLDNILPSRTRRRAAKPGFFIADGPQDEDSDA